MPCLALVLESGVTNMTLKRTISGMTEKQGVTEELKAQDQMERVRLMNNIKASAEEIVLKNMIYV